MGACLLITQVPTPSTERFTTPSCMSRQETRAHVSQGGASDAESQGNAEKQERHAYRTRNFNTRYFFNVFSLQTFCDDVQCVLDPLQIYPRIWPQRMTADESMSARRTRSLVNCERIRYARPQKQCDASDGTMKMTLH